MRYPIAVVLILISWSSQQSNSQDLAKPKNLPITEANKDLVKIKTFGNRFDRVELKYKTFSPDKRFYVGFYRDGWDEIISIHETKSRKQIKRVLSGGDNVSKFKFSENGNLLASYATKKGWKVWEIPSGKRLFELSNVMYETDAKNQQK